MPIATGAVSVEEASGRFLADSGFAPNTRRTYAFPLAALAQAVGSNTDVAAVTAAQIADLLTTRWGGPNIAASTFNRYRSTLRSFFDWCAERGWVGSNPVADTSMRANDPGRWARPTGRRTGQASGSDSAIGLGQPLPTPTGWITLGDLNAGDVVFSADGRPVLVAQVRGLRRADSHAARTCARLQWTVAPGVDLPALGRLGQRRAVPRSGHLGQWQLSSGPLGIDVVADQEIEIRLGPLFSDRDVCSADMSGHVTAVELPQGITPAKALVARFEEREVTIEAVGR